MKKILFTLISIFGFASVAFALPYYSQTQGLVPGQTNVYYIGTTTPSTLQYLGIFTKDITISNLGGSGTRCVQVSNTGVLSKASAACGSGGGGSGGGSWSTTTSSVAGQLINYPNNSTDIIVIGDSATTSAPWFYDPNIFRGYIKGNIGFGTSSPSQPLSVQGNGLFSGNITAANITATGTIAAASATLTNALTVANGGTGQQTFTASQLLYGNGTTALSAVATTTLTASSPLSLSNTVVKVGGSNSVLTIDTTGTWSGLAGTATALAADGANCSAGNYPLGVDASGAVQNCTAAGTGTVTAVTGTWPIISSGGNTPAISFGGLSTSTAAVVGNIPYFSGVNTFANVATGTVTCTGSASCGAGSYVLGNALTINATGGGGTGTVSTSTNETAGGLPYWTTTSGTPAKLGQTATTTLTASGLVAVSNSPIVIGASGAVITLSAAANSVLVNNTSATAAPIALATTTFGTTLYGAGTGGQVLAWSNTTGAPVWNATSTCLQITGSSDLCDGIDNTAAGAINPFTWATNFGVINAATSSALWAQSGINASSTSQIASTTFNLNGQILNQVGSASLPAFSFNGDADTGMYQSGANTLKFPTNGVDRLTLDTSGIYCGSGASSGFCFLNINNSASLPPYSFNGDPNTGIFWAAADTFGFSTGGIEAARFDSGQLLGLGTTTPKWKLTVASSTGPQLGLSDGLGSNVWTLRNINSNLYFATSTYTATSTVSAFSIDSNGYLYNPTIKSSSGTNCLQIGTTGQITNTGSACGAAANTLANGLTATTTFYSGGVLFSDASKLTQSAAQANFFWDETNKRLGLGTTTPGTTLVVQGGAIINSEIDLATSSSMNVYAASSTAQRIRMGGGNMTVTLGARAPGTAADVRGEALRLMVCNPNGTSGTLTWAYDSSLTTILWPGGTIPAKTTTANKCDLYGFTFTGATSTAAGITAFGSQSAAY